MTPVKQTRIGAKGNCLQACVASILDLPVDDVPHFILYKDSWFFALELFMKDFGFKYEGTGLKPDLNDYPGIDGYVIAAGESPRGRMHAVIYKAGEMVHDPHPEGGGIDFSCFYMFTTLDL